MSAGRHCFASLPEHLSELPNGRRIGPINRPGYEPAWDAAGQPFTTGERDSRNVMIVDDLPRKLANPLAAFDETGAAGLCSPRIDLRAVTVDDPIHRARSSPPDLVTTRLVQQMSLQAFGVRDDIDSPRFRRRVYSVQSNSPTRDQTAKMAVRFSNIDEIVARKQFHGTAAPGAWMSPRYAARCTELVDIDSHGGRMSPKRALAAEEILPTNESFELTPTNEWTFEQTSRPHNMTYFVKTLEAEKYAQVLGRPQSRLRTTESLKLENLQKRERGWQMYASTTKELTESCTSLELHACDWSVVSSEPNSPKSPGRQKMARHKSFSALSTEASDSGSVRSDRDTPLSKASRSIFNSFDAAYGMNFTSGCLAEDEDYESHSPKKVPLGIRRSMLPDGTELSGSMANQLQAAVQKLAKTPTKAIQKNVRAQATRALQRHNIASPSRRRGHAPETTRQSNSTRSEEIKEPSVSSRPELIAVAG